MKIRGSFLGCFILLAVLCGCGGNPLPIGFQNQSTIPDAQLMEWWRVAQTATFTPGAAYYPGQYEALPSDPRAALLQPRGVIFTVVDPNMWDGGFRCSDYGNLPSYATNPSCLGLTVYGSGGQPDHIYVVKGEWKALPMGNLKGQAAVAAYEMQNSIYHSLGGNMDGR